MGSVVSHTGLVGDEDTVLCLYICPIFHATFSQQCMDRPESDNGTPISGMCKP